MSKKNKECWEEIKEEVKGQKDFKKSKKRKDEEISLVWLCFMVNQHLLVFNSKWWDKKVRKKDD